LRPRGLKRKGRLVLTVWGRGLRGTEARYAGKLELVSCDSRERKKAALGAKEERVVKRQ